MPAQNFLPGAQPLIKLDPQSQIYSFESLYLINIHRRLFFFFVESTVELLNHDENEFFKSLNFLVGMNLDEPLIYITPLRWYPII